MQSLDPVMRHSADPYIGIAPGRLDVMGGIADYSGSLLLQMPIKERTEVIIEHSEDFYGRFLVQSGQERIACQIGVEALAGIPYREIGPVLRSTPGGDWAAYVLGCYAVLAEEKGLRYQGARITIRSEVPVGKGVSSSASLEVATMHAICKAYNIPLDPIELALLAQKVENLVVGAACGLMDQLSVNLGRENHLLPIICQPHEVLDPLEIPAGLRFLGLDSGVRHAVSGASYSEVRTAAFMAFTVAMVRTGTAVNLLPDPSSLPFGGCWANISPQDFCELYGPQIPTQMKGSDYLREFGVHIDPVTAVDPDRIYPLYQSALHPVSENRRIHDFKTILEGLGHAEDPEILLITAGRLMLASHEGYNAVGLGEPVTNRIVDLVRQKRGAGQGIYGARISGGGSGGTVTVMIGSDIGYQHLLDIKRVMEWETGKELKLFEGSSDGAEYIN